MLLGKNLILATKPFAKEIRTKSWFHTISTLSILIITLVSTLIIPVIALKLVCSIIAGLLLIRMFIIYHDHQHHTILTKSGVAEVMPHAIKVDFWDINEMANQISSVVSNDSLRDELYTNSLREYQNLSWNHAADKLFEVYNYHQEALAA